MKVEVVAKPDTSKSNSPYPANKPPLLPNPLVKLPLGSVRPRGWLKKQLDLMVDGITGRLNELSEFQRPDNGWFGTDNEGWEDQPYWLRGFYPLAALTGKEHLLAEANRWIEAVLTSQDSDGYFGAPANKRVLAKDGTVITDLFPNMLMLDAIIQHYEHTGDARVIPLIKRYFEFCRDLPDDMFLPRKYWDPKIYFSNYESFFPIVQYGRAGDMLPSIYWLYNRTGEEWLLALATRVFQRQQPPVGEWLDDHIVNFTQRFAYSGTYYQQSHEQWHFDLTEYWYAQHMGTWGQQPRGIFGADERIRPGCVDPRQGFETCGMTEFAKRFYLLGRITGNPLYADRCEDIILNHFPPSQTPDLKGLHYLTASNQPQLDAGEGHEYRNTGRQLSYSPHTYRCCRNNVAMGWPWYAENLWQGTFDGGLAAWTYAASDVTAKVGPEGKEVALSAETDYPFTGTVKMTVTAAEGADFPLYLRVPGWCRRFAVSVNGKRLDVAPEPRTYVRIERAWSAGDTVEVDMPMELGITEWPRTGSVTVDRGPLSYSVRIEEEWRRCGGTDEWPEWEVLPKSPWNWGLVIDRENPAASLEVTEKGISAEQPWTVEAAPIEIRAKAKRIPGWKLENETVEELRPSPIASDETTETIRMIPLGCARLRMSCLPVIGEPPEAQGWLQPMYKHADKKEPW
jgi:hypothetical protein